MTCGEVESVLTAFMDGELRGDEMRHVACHLARCVDCEAASTRLERLQQSIRGAIMAQVDKVPNLQVVWDGIASQLGAPTRSLRERLATLADRVNWGVPAPVWVGSAMAAALVGGILLWSSPEREPERRTRQSYARIDYLKARDNVRVWKQESGTLVIWVDDEGMNVERLDP